MYKLSFSLKERLVALGYGAVVGCVKNRISRGIFNSDRSVDSWHRCGRGLELPGSSIKVNRFIALQLLCFPAERRGRASFEQTIHCPNIVPTSLDFGLRSTSARKAVRSPSGSKSEVVPSRRTSRDLFLRFPWA